MQFFFLFSLFLSNHKQIYKHKNRNFALHTNTLEHINLFEKKITKTHTKSKKKSISISVFLSLTLNHWIQRIHAFKTHAHDMNKQKTHAIIGMEYVMVHAWSHVLFKKHQKVKVVHVVGKYHLIQNYFD